MIRVNRLTDYGIVLLTHFALEREGETRSARELAAKAHIPLPTVSKLLKRLAQKGILMAHRGKMGGFRLARGAEGIPLGEIIDALEGPVTITECSGDAHERCNLERRCPVRSKWRRISDAVAEALRGISLEELANPWTPVHVRAALDLAKEEKS